MSITSVSGPGQNASMSRRVSGGQLGMFAGLVRVGDVDDERIEARAPLGGEDRGDGRRVGRVGAEAVHRLGRKGDEAPRAQVLCGGAYCLIRCLDDAHGGPRSSICVRTHTRSG